MIHTFDAMEPLPGNALEAALLTTGLLLLLQGNEELRSLPGPRWPVEKTPLPHLQLFAGSCAAQPCLQVWAYLRRPPDPAAHACPGAVAYACA